MSKKAKLIISILSSIIVILIIIVIVLLSKNNQSDTGTPQASSKDIKNIVGIYHNNNWNGREASLYLNSDMTCKYPSNDSICNWEIIDGQTIKISLSKYNLRYKQGDSDYIYSYATYGTLENCESTRETRFKNSLDQAKCILESGGGHQAIYTNSGIDLHEHLFYKIG